MVPGSREAGSFNNILEAASPWRSSAQNNPIWRHLFYVRAQGVPPGQWAVLNFIFCRWGHLSAIQVKPSGQMCSLSDSQSRHFSQCSHSLPDIWNVRSLPALCLLPNVSCSHHRAKSLAWAEEEPSRTHRGKLWGTSADLSWLSCPYLWLPGPHEMLI